MFVDVDGFVLCFISLLQCAVDAASVPLCFRPTDILLGCIVYWITYSAAERALALDAGCIEAHNLLALRVATSAAEAAEHLERAVQAGAKVCVLYCALVGEG